MSVWRQEFPAIISHPEFIFFDNAGTTQKPQAVIEAMNHVWKDGVFALNRSSCQLADHQTLLVEQALKTIASFFGAKQEQLICCHNATEAFNLIVYNVKHLLAKDEVVILGRTNHSSNLIAWQKYFPVKYLPFTSTGFINEEILQNFLTDEKVRLISLTWASNVLGQKENLKKISSLIKHANQKRTKKIYLVIDASANTLSEKINFIHSGVDLMVVSAHKMYGPFIAGILANNELMTQLQPFNLGGGNMLYDFQDAWQFQAGNKKFLSGVTDIVALIGWAEACRWLQKEQKAKNLYLKQLTANLVQALQSIKGVKILGQGQKTHLVTFTMEHYQSSDINAYLNIHNFCLRTGYHCAPLIYQDLQLTSGVRLSLAHYNQVSEIEALSTCLAQMPQHLKPSSKLNL